MKLSQTVNNCEYIIKSIMLPCEDKYRLYDLGIVENSIIKRVRKSPLGDPASYCVGGTLFAIRNMDAEKIEVDPYE